MITEVSNDMSPAYIAGLKENLEDQAVVVFEKFQIIAHVNKALDETRRGEQRLALQADAECSRGNRWVLLKNSANHTPKLAPQHQALIKRNLATVKAH